MTEPMVAESVVTEPVVGAPVVAVRRGPARPRWNQHFSVIP